MIDENEITWDFDGSDNCDPYGHLPDGRVVTREKDGRLKVWNQAMLRPDRNVRAGHRVLNWMRNQ